MPVVTLQQLVALPERLDKAAKAAFITQVRAAKDIARAEAARDVGADLRMSGVGRNGVKLGVRDSMRLASGRWTAKVWGTPPGVWAILSDGAAAHQIDRRRRRRRRDGRGAAPLAIGDELRVGPFSHPGSPAKGTWRRVRRRVEAETPTRWAADVLAAIRGG